jgi:hypothetical protein
MNTLPKTLTEEELHHLQELCPGCVWGRGDALTQYNRLTNTLEVTFPWFKNHGRPNRAATERLWKSFCTHTLGHEITLPEDLQFLDKGWCFNITFNIPISK